MEASQTPQLKEQKENKNEQQKTNNKTQGRKVSKTSTLAFPQDNGCTRLAELPFRSSVDELHKTEKKQNKRPQQKAHNTYLST